MDAQVAQLWLSDDEFGACGLSNHRNTPVVQNKQFNKSMLW